MRAARSPFLRPPAPRQPSTSIDSPTGRSPEAPHRPDAALRARRSLASGDEGIHARARSPARSAGRTSAAATPSQRAPGAGRDSAAPRRTARSPRLGRGTSGSPSTSFPPRSLRMRAMPARRRPSTVTCSPTTYGDTARPAEPKTRSPGAATRTTNGSIRCRRSSRSVPPAEGVGVEVAEHDEHAFPGARVEVAAVGGQAQRCQRARAGRGQPFGPRLHDPNRMVDHGAHGACRLRSGRGAASSGS